MAFLIGVRLTSGNSFEVRGIENIRYINEDSYGKVIETEQADTLVVCPKNVATLVVREQA